MTDKKNKETSHTSLIKNAFMYYDINTRQYEKEFKKIRYQKMNYSKNDVEQATIELYGKDNALLKICTFQILGDYDKDTQMFSWAWSNSTLPKQMTKIARKLFNYGSNIPFIETMEKSITNPEFKKSFFPNDDKNAYCHTFQILKDTEETGFKDTVQTEKLSDTIGIFGLKSQLINSNIHISYSAQLDMLLALSMYLSKQTRLYKFLDGQNIRYIILLTDVPES